MPLLGAAESMVCHSSHSLHPKPKGRRGKGEEVGSCIVSRLRSNQQLPSSSSAGRWPGRVAGPCPQRQGSPQTCSGSGSRSGMVQLYHGTPSVQEETFICGPVVPLGEMAIGCRSTLCAHQQAGLRHRKQTGSGNPDKLRVVPQPTGQGRQAGCS